MSGATPAYRGYRLQALYILHCLLTGTNDNLIFHPEGIEDLDIHSHEGILQEVVQIKSYETLRLSHLGSEKKQFPFFKRAASLLHQNPHVTVKVINFGDIGDELQSAWQLRSDPIPADREQVAQKLVAKHGLTSSDVSVVLDRVELIPVDEPTVSRKVMQLLQDTVAGIDASSAFDLFMQWIYQLSEQQASITKTHIIAKLNNIGRTLMDRTHFITEWHTSIKPVGTTAGRPSTPKDILRTEFFAGVSVRYDHIEAGLDFRRDDKLTTIVAGFREHNVVIIHGASGQGKTALAYRYLHDYYPTIWQYEVVLIETPAHALKIAAALNAQAAALEAPTIVYIDVHSNDTHWAELVEQLARHPYINVLVTVREEDFRRTNLPRHRLDFVDIGLQFNELEAQRIYARAVEANSAIQGRFLNFEASWEAFNSAGPLLEYVYLLTQTVMLHDRLQEQLTTISNEVQGKEVTDKWDILRWVAIASAYESRILHTKLHEMVAKPSLCGQILKQLEEEYLLRRSADGHYIEGLHPIRSKILIHLIAQNDPIMWWETAKEVLPALHEADLQPFILNALVDRPLTDQKLFLSYLTTFQAETWSGNAGILRALLWVGVRDYMEANRMLINQVRGLAQSGWYQVVLDVDIANLLEEPFPFDKILFERATSEKRQQIETYRTLQTPKADVFKHITTWLQALHPIATAPITYGDWIGLAEMIGWAGHLEIAQYIETWITDAELSALIHTHDLRLIGDISTALHKCNAVRHQQWIDRHCQTLDTRLANEYQILGLERHESDNKDDEARIHIHFIPSQIQHQVEVNPVLSRRSADSDQLHAAAIERIEVVRFLYPTYTRYASQGYGFGFGDLLELPFDSTRKDVKAHSLPPHWLVRINHFVRGIGEYPYRPQAWEDYVSYLMKTRHMVVDNLRKLQAGLIRYLGSSKSINIIVKYLGTSNWTETKNLLSQTPHLPQCAVDKWGFSSEAKRASTLSPTEAFGLLGLTDDNVSHSTSRYIPNPIAYQYYTPYLQAQHSYLDNLATFFEQSIHVLATNYVLGKYHQNDPRRQTVQQKVEQQGYRTNLAHSSTRVYWSAVLQLEAYQHQFRQLLSLFVDNEELLALEDAERSVVRSTWMYWYFFANHPDQSYPNVRHRILQNVEQVQMDIDSMIDQVLDGIALVKNKTWKAMRITPGGLWKERTALWILLDVTDPLDQYASIEVFIEHVRKIFGRRDPSALNDYLLEQQYYYCVIIPTVRGKLIRPMVFAPTFASILADKELSETPFSFFPAPLTPEHIHTLKLSQWEGMDIAMANQLSDAVHVVRVIASQISQFNKLPEAAITEAGYTQLKQHVDEQITTLYTYVQQYIDAGNILLHQMQELSEIDRENRGNLVACGKLLTEVSDTFLPQDDDMAQGSLSALYAYAKKLEPLESMGEILRLLWIADILDTQ